LYAVGALALTLQARGSFVDELPPVVPMLAHQGPGGWKISTDFGELYGAMPEALRPYVISFQHALVDLAHIEDSALSAHLRLREIVEDVLRRLEPSRMEQIMTSFGAGFAQEGFERGRAEGEAVGKAVGKAEGQATALIRVLEKRLGPLPAHLRKRISAADLASIENWLDRAIDALDLQSVFGAEAKGWSRPAEHEAH
jgi:hypothetical protein